MKRVYISVVAILLVIGVILALRFRSNIGFLREWLPTRSSNSVLDAAAGKESVWRPVDESSQGFKVEMPGDPRQIVVQADNEAGSTEPISMLQVKPQPDRSFAIAWADKPPV